MKFGCKHIQHLWRSLAAALLVLTLVPFSAMAVTENVLEPAPEINTTEDLPEEDPTEEKAETDDSWDDEYSYLPYESYLPERGTTPEEDQYYNPRLSDGELARYKELLAMLDNKEITLDGIPSCANLMEMDENPVRVYTLNPDDFDGETFYVLLPWNRKMDDGQLLSLIASFRELGISFDPDSLNERNCTRRAYSGKNRDLSEEEEFRSRAMRHLIVRGMLTREDAASASAGVCTEKIPGYRPFCIYPYRSLSDNELAVFLFAEYSVWETDPDLIERTALNAVRDILRLPLSLSVADEKAATEPNDWKAFTTETVNRYVLEYERANRFHYTESDDKPAELAITMLESPGVTIVLQGLYAYYAAPYNETEFIQDNDEVFLAAAEKWAGENLLLPESQKAFQWSIFNTNQYEVTLHAITDEWDITLAISRDLYITYLSMWALKYDEYADHSNDDYDDGVFVPADNRPSARSPIPYSAATQPLQTDFLESSYPWMTDLELARSRILMDAMDAGELTYQGPSIVNVPFDSQNGAAVYALNPEDFDGETFYVMLPDLQMNDEQLLALISAFRELGINLDSLNGRNCCRFCNAYETRSLTTNEQRRSCVVLDRIISGELSKADLAADTRALTVEKTNSSVSYGSTTGLFCFYPYRKLTDDELALFLFNELERFDTDPNRLMYDAIDSAMDSISLPSAWMLDKTACTEMDFYSKHLKQYTNVFYVEPSSNWTGTCAPAWLTVKHSQMPGKDPELSGIRLVYGYTDRNKETQVYPAAQAEQIRIAAAQQWAEENLKLPTEKADWILTSEKLLLSGSNSKIQLQLLTDDWDIRLWIYESSLQPSECYLYSRKWYEVSDEDLAWIKSVKFSDRADDPDQLDSDLLKENYKLSNGYFF